MSSDDEPIELPPLFIRERMANPRVTGETLAERMGTTPATVSRLINGKRKMTLEWLYAFAKALDTPIASLFTAPGDEPKVRGDREVRRLIGRIDGFPSDAIEPVLVFINAYLSDGGQSRPAPPRGQSEPASRRRAKAPSR